MSDVEICNMALFELGAVRIDSLSEATNNARTCKVFYDIIRKSELRKHPWSFAVEIASIAADATAPLYGKARSFTQPSDCLRVLAPYDIYNDVDLDWQVQGRKIYTDDSAPLQIRYIKNVTDTSVMDVLFIRAFSLKLAMAMCEKITQSKTLKDELRLDYRDAIGEARRANAIEKTASEPPEDKWITVRR